MEIFLAECIYDPTCLGIDMSSTIVNNVNNWQQHAIISSFQKWNELELGLKWQLLNVTGSWFPGIRGYEDRVTIKLLNSKIMLLIRVTTVLSWTRDWFPVVWTDPQNTWCHEPKLVKILGHKYLVQVLSTSNLYLDFGSGNWFPVAIDNLNYLAKMHGNTKF